MVLDESTDDAQREAVQENADHDRGRKRSTDPFAGMNDEELDSFFAFLERNELDESPFED